MMGKKRAYCPNCGERCKKQKVESKYVLASMAGAMKEGSDGVKRYRHFCVACRRVVLHPIWSKSGLKRVEI